jgi:hypothetical protein
LAALAPIDAILAGGDLSYHLAYAAGADLCHYDTVA